MTARVKAAIRMLAVILVLVLLPSAASANSKNSGKIPEAAKLYFKNGIELLQATPPNYQDAYHQFKEAFRISKSWQVLGNLGFCALKLERDGEALAHYKEYLKSGGGNVDPEERADIERDLLLIEGNMAQVVITVNRPGVIVTDSRQDSTAPPQVYELEPGRNVLGLRSGSHQLVAASGAENRTWKVTLTPRKNFEHTFDFDAPEQAAPAAPAAKAQPASKQTVDSTSSESGTTARTVGWVMAGAGVAALAGGVVTGLLKSGSEDDARARLRADSTRCLGDVCSNDAEAEFDEAESLALWSNVLLIGGGVLAATGTGLVIWGSSQADGERPAASARVTLTPLAAPGMAGIFADGSF